MRVFLFFLFMLTPAFMPAAAKAEAVGTQQEKCTAEKLADECIRITLLRARAEARRIVVPEGCDTEKCLRKALGINFRQIDVDRVVDGDTFITDGKEFHVYIIIAPEADEPKGALATRRLKELLTSQDPRPKCRKMERYIKGKPSMQCFYNGLDVGEIMIREGLAVRYRHIERPIHFCPYVAEKKCPDGSLVGLQTSDCKTFEPCPGGYQH